MVGVNLVYLKIKSGDFDRGFEVTLRITKSASFSEVDGILPPDKNIPKIYENWQENYLHMDWIQRGKTGKSFNPANVFEKCHELSQELRLSVKNWLKNENKEFQKLRETLIKELDPKDEIRVVIQTQDELLQKLPWQEWDLFSDAYTKAEIVLNLTENDTRQTTTIIERQQSQVKILAIFGADQELQTDADESFIRSLTGADPHFLKYPKRSDLSDRLWEESWDILFFAGHAKNGEFDINQDESLTIQDLKRGLRKLIQSGLQLAIFNSCDGLKLAKNLAELNIPQVIVMREEIPDLVAQKFLKYFLKEFSAGNSLYLAVKYARERLVDEGLDQDFPGVGWLPVICDRHPNVEAPTWVELIKDYYQLEYLLAAGKWREADQSTFNLMLKVANRTKEGWLSKADLEMFPAKDLRTLDQLWVKYSNGRFGFSVQKRIWQQIGGNMNTFDPEAEKRFGDAVGWRRRGMWMEYSNLLFIASAPIGHLPAPTPVNAEGIFGTFGFGFFANELASSLGCGVWPRLGLRLLTLMSRIENCQL